MIVTKILCQDVSNRSTILFNAILPFLRSDTSVLDIGCGYADYPKFQGTILPLLLKESLPKLTYHGIDNRSEVIAQCKMAYPWGEWTVGDASRFVPERLYDIVFHLGFDRKDLSDAWKIHSKLSPRIVLLEAGSPSADIISKHIESYLEVLVGYEMRGYFLRADNNYIWSYPVTQPSRRYAILERDE